MAMKNRCYYTEDTAYKYYGGRGIRICDEWLNSEKFDGRSTKGWVTFQKWALEHGYCDGLTIDRINSNGDYEPSNCRWITMKAQSNNRRSNRLITYKGKTQTLQQWSEEYGFNYDTIIHRLHLGWSVERAIETKNDSRAHLITYKNKTQSLTDWCKELNLNYNRVKQRINSCGWSVEKAFEA